MAKSGRHFLQIPGPTNVPDRVLRALSKPTIDHRGPEFATLAREALSGLKEVLLTSPPGISFNAISDKALAASKTAKLPRAYWDWEPMLRDNKAGFFPYTPSTNILYGLREALNMMRDEGLEAIW